MRSRPPGPVPRRDGPADRSTDRAKDTPGEGQSKFRSDRAAGPRSIFTVKTLVGTGDLEYTTSRRLIETAAWWLDVTTPGAMQPGAEGYRAALRIRLVHAHVRAAMNRRDDWDYEAWDHPVNQVQTVGTLLLFSQVFVLGTQMLGIRYTKREREDILHLWRYIGWLMGISEALLPASEEDAWRLLWLLAATEFIPDQDSHRLAQALLATHADMGQGFGPLSGVVGAAATNLHVAISRMLIGKENADFLGLPSARVGQVAVLGFSAANFAAETARRLVPGATALQEKVGELTRKQFLGRLGRMVPLDRSYAARLRSSGEGSTTSAA